MNVYELQPINNQKSFYGKAQVFTAGNVKLLKSYDTFVAAVTIDENGKEIFHRLWSGWSATTAKHLQAFSDLYRGKKAWAALPVESHSDLEAFINFIWGIR